MRQRKCLDSYANDTAAGSNFEQKRGRQTVINVRAVPEGPKALKNCERMANGHSQGSPSLGKGKRKEVYQNPWVSACLTRLLPLELRLHRLALSRVVLIAMCLEVGGYTC